MNSDSISKFDFMGIQRVSKQDWLSKINTDLKSTDIHELSKSFDGDLLIDAFATTEELPNKVVPLDSWRKGWYSCVSIRRKANKDLNASILKYLESGAEGVKIDLEDDIQNVYDKVHPAFIYNDITASNQEALIKFVNNWNADKDVDCFGCLNLDFDQIINLPALKNFHHYNVEIRIEDSKINAIYDAFVKIISLLEKGIDPDLIRIELHAVDHLLHNVLMIRSAKVLWNNVLKHFNLKIRPVFMYINAKQTLSNHQGELLLISATNMAVSGVIGGADMISLIEDENDNDDNARLGLNIQHIMKMESKLDQVLDPLCGSYVIEKTTRAIANHVWQKL